MCYMLRTTRYILHATTVFPYAQLESSISAATSASLSSSFRHHGDRYSSPQRGGTRSSRSRSPTRHSKRRRSPPARHKDYQGSGERGRAPSSRHNQSFRSGASSTGLSACAVCLGRHPHDISKCSTGTLWDGSNSRCKRNEQKRLVNPEGLIICSDWQRPSGCTTSGHNHRHECSGCGKTSHGAQSCPRTQKGSSPHSA
jgi:hypothetical protein